MKRKTLGLFAALAVLAFGISLFVGRYSISPAEILRPESMSFRVFFNLRLPRTAVALIAGAGLALGGYVFQTLFSNPIASPDIIGVASGAGTGAACAILLFGSGALTTACGAMAGGFLAVVMALALVRRAGSQNTAAFLLAGIVVNSLAQSALMAIKLAADPESQLASIEYWLMGSLSAVTGNKALPVCILALLGIVPLVAMSKTVDLLSLPSDEAQLLGVNVGKMRGLVILLATLAVTAVTSVTGLISFIGLLAPHGARLILKNNSRATLVLSMLMGGILVLGADCLARSLLTRELPISILTSLIGAPYLVWLMVKRGGRV